MMAVCMSQNAIKEQEALKALASDSLMHAPECMHRTGTSLCNQDNALFAPPSV